MSEVYKKFTAQDYSVTPFTAHKQYNFVSASASSNSINIYNSSYTSESVSLYSSASTNPDGLFDEINHIKYKQIDHLFYKNYKIDLSNRFGKIDYLRHKRELYEKTNIISLPTGLYGHEVKPGSFYLSSSNYKIVDDTYGNLIISGTNVNNYPTDIRSNLLRIDPIKGYKSYDLKVEDGYAVIISDDKSAYQKIKRFYRQGETDPNASLTYSTPEGLNDTDDSYFFNSITYNNVTFKKSKLGSPNHKFSTIKFNSITGSNIVIPHSENFNFNQENDFAISFYMEPTPILEEDVSIGMKFGGGIVFEITGSEAYIIYPHIIGAGDFQTVSSSKINVGSTNITAGTNNDPIPGGNISGFGSGSLMTQRISNFNTIGSGDFTPIYTHILNSTINGYDDWWIPNRAEIIRVSESLDPYHNSDFDFGGNPIDEEIFVNKDNTPFLFAAPEKFRDKFTQMTAYQNGSPLNLSPQNAFNPLIFGNGTSIFISEEFSPTKFSTFRLFDGRFHFTGQHKMKGMSSFHPVFSFAIRKQALYKSDQTNPGFDNKKRYIIAKSTTKTIIPTSKEGQSEILGTNVSGNLQSIDASAEPQFPFEIYMQSESIYFDRSDGDRTTSINAIVTASGIFGSVANPSGSIKTLSHILCQKTGSNLEIYINGDLKSSGIDKTDQTQNTANVYIGTKGQQSKNDQGVNNLFKFFNGTLNNINIYGKSFNTTEIANISSSINASPYIGNMFYQHGFATITHPSFQNVDLPGNKIELFNVNSYKTKTPTEDSLFLYKSALTSSAAFSNDFSFCNGMHFHPSGTQMYLNNVNQIAKFNLSEPWDVTTSTIHSTASLLSGSGLHGTGSLNSLRDMQFTPDGKNLILLTQNYSASGFPGTALYVITGSSEFEITGSVMGYGDWTNTESYRYAVPKKNNTRDALGFAWKDEYNYFLVGGFSGSAYVTELEITGSPYDVSTSRLTGKTFSLDSTPSASNFPGGIDFSPNGNKMFIVSKRPGPIILEYDLTTPWDITTAQINKTADIQAIQNSYQAGVGGSDGQRRYSTFGPHDVQFMPSSGSLPAGHRYYILTGDNNVIQLESKIKNDYKLEFQGSHLIYENEYQCTVDEHEYNDTLNISARKIKSQYSNELAGFATSSLFKPYVTTIGLYNENQELLVVGKLGQPIRMSDETDTTFILRWDT